MGSRIVHARRGSAGLLAVALLALAGCAGLRPAPEYLDRLDFIYTEGVPVEVEPPPLRSEGLTADELNTVRIYHERSRAVVNITALSVYRGRFGRLVPEGGTGSGLIIDQQGTVVTNHHVVDGAQRLIVTLHDGSHYRGRLLGADPELDLAVLRFEPQGRALTTIPSADSDRLQVGQKVLALGNPFGLEGSLTTGVISALNRPLAIRSGFIIRDLIQTDAAINPGNSGGPLLNSRGELIGMNSMLISPTPGSSGIGLAVPANAVGRSVDQILREGRVRRGWIDIEGVALDRRLARAAGLPVAQGVLVTRAPSGGNAARAGLRDGRGGREVRHGPYRIPVEGDVIVAVDGARVGGVPELLASLEATRPGDAVVVTVLRQGERHELGVVLSGRPESH